MKIRLFHKLTAPYFEIKCHQFPKDHIPPIPLIYHPSPSLAIPSPLHAFYIH